MININLLPQDVGGKSQKNFQPSATSGTILVSAILILAYLIVFAVGGYLFVSSQRVIQEANTKKAKAAALKKEFEDTQSEYKELSEQVKVLENQLLLLEVLDPDDRLYWAEKINLLPQVVPDGIFLASIEVVEDVRERETKESREAMAKWQKAKKENRSPQPPRKVTYPEITYTMELSGFSYVEDGTDDQRLQLIIDFNQAVRTQEIEIPFSGEKATFMDNFNSRIEMSPVIGKKMSGKDVMEFTFTLKSDPIIPSVLGNAQASTS